MAEVYKFVRGMPIEKFMAKRGEVQRELEVHAREAYARAQALLASHHKTGNAQIEYEKGEIDRYIILHDPDRIVFDEETQTTRFQPGDAMAIEVGHGNEWDLDGHTDGLWILHDAVGLPHE